MALIQRTSQCLFTSDDFETWYEIQHHFNIINGMHFPEKHVADTMANEISLSDDFDILTTFIVYLCKFHFQEQVEELVPHQFYYGLANGEMKPSLYFIRTKAPVSDIFLNKKGELEVRYEDGVSKILAKGYSKTFII